MTSMHLNTPLLRSLALSGDHDRTVWLKMDALQPCGSFKLRGIGAACAHHAGAGKRRFVSSSGGNAGIAVAYAGRQLSIPVSVFVPQTTTETAKALIRQQGADVIVHGASWQEANERAWSTVGDDVAFIHPFDDPLLWQGHATMIDEVVAAGAAFDAVVLSVGGGGLLCGVAEGLARNGLGETPIVAVETRGADSLAASLATGERVELPAITSIATSLGARPCMRAGLRARGPGQRVQRRRRRRRRDRRLYAFSERSPGAGRAGVRRGAGGGVPAAGVVRSRARHRLRRRDGVAGAAGGVARALVGRSAGADGRMSGCERCVGTARE
jgi:L-serine/L-threonine ammonia-lyase